MTILAIYSTCFTPKILAVNASFEYRIAASASTAHLKLENVAPSSRFSIYHTGNHGAKSGPTEFPKTYGTASESERTFQLS